MQNRPLIILQVEDTPADAQLTALAMDAGKIPHSLHVVTDGGQAVEFLKRSGPYADSPRPDVILLDIDLPRLNGNEVLEFIKSDDQLKSIPVIIFSTSDSEEIKKHAYDLHANSYVVKPMDLAGFMQKVQAIAEYWCKVSEIAMQPAA